MEQAWRGHDMADMGAWRGQAAPLLYYGSRLAPFVPPRSLLNGIKYLLFLL